MSTGALLALMAACAPQVDPTTARALIAVESSFNPYAIGVVNGVLERQPTRRAEAIATARALQANGWNFSVGLAQINVRNFDRLHLSLETAFDACTNLAAMQAVLAECLARASARETVRQTALRQALSCYYSGNLVTGFQQGYVRRVVSAAREQAIPSSPRKES
jgi:type IV secretion system protein VirB1